MGGLLAKLVGRVPIPGACAQLAGLRLTAERFAGRRHQIASVLVHRVDPGRRDAVEAGTSARDEGAVHEDPTAIQQDVLKPAKDVLQ